MITCATVKQAQPCWETSIPEFWRVESRSRFQVQSQWSLRPIIVIAVDRSGMVAFVAITESSAVQGIVPLLQDAAFRHSRFAQNRQQESELLKDALETRETYSIFTVQYVRLYHNASMTRSIRFVKLRRFAHT